MSTFKDLNLSRPYLNAIDDLGFTEPTPIQEKSFPVVMSGKDVVGIAQTGTGKTIAYMLPLLRMLPYSKEKKPRILVLVPTRELVIQVVDHVEQLIPYTDLVVQGFYGGANIKTQRDRAYDGADIIVSTPGRLIDLVLSCALSLKSIQKLVVDEVDEMLNLGLRHQIIQLLELIPKKRQSLLFSATLSIDVEEIIEKHFRKPVKIEIARSGIPLDNITQLAYSVPNFYTKLNLLEYLLETNEDMSKVMIFVKNKNVAELMYRLLDLRMESTFRVIHTSKSQNFRIRSVKMFTEGDVRVLIATDLISRGVDVEGVTHVINFNLPQTPETYIHRIGRTGRAEKEGIAISFINEYEEKYQKEIEQLMEQKIDMIEIPSHVEISDQFLDEEQIKLGDVSYRKRFKEDDGKGAAFHEKKEKNQKIHLGGPGMRKPKKTKPINRGRLRAKAKKRKDDENKNKNKED
jgi:ATP-dependent RNA helicase RhlE